MLDDQEIKRLLLRTAARDSEAFAMLYRLTAPLLLGIAQRVVARRELAEEVLHDAFVKVWKAAESFDPLANQPVAWLAAIVRNRAIDVVSSADHARVDSSDRAIDDADGLLERWFTASGNAAPGADEALEQGRIADWLRDCMGGLAPVERQTLVLAYHHGMSHGDLAEHLQKPLGTVKSWVRRGLANLRDCVEACMGQGGAR